MKITNQVLAILFGNQVGDSDKERQYVTFRYKRRQNKLVGLSGLIIAGFAVFMVWEAANQSIAAGITVAFAALYIVNIYALACASDAIFDSLFERINLQSEWLKTRLDHIELAVAKGEMLGQRAWDQLANSEHEDIEEACYYEFPELSRSGKHKAGFGGNGL